MSAKFLLLAICLCFIAAVVPAHVAYCQETPAPTQPVEKPKSDADLLAQAVEAINDAKKAIEEGDAKLALAKLDEAEELVLSVHAKMVKPPQAVPANEMMHEGVMEHMEQPMPEGAEKSKVVNTKCPILGTAINPATVPPGLTRLYKGQKVGFCCGGCPESWDKLSDEQKDAKLKAAM